MPREEFVPADKIDSAYVEENVDLGGSRVVLEPRTLAKMLDALDIQADELVLDLGCGLGYSSAVMARMAEAVVAVEDDEARADEAQAALSRAGADNVAVHVGALAEGAAKHGPYDVVVLQGAAEHLPEAIIDQVKEGGRIAALLVEGALGTVKIGYKIDGVMSWRFAFNAGAPVLPGFERHQALHIVKIRANVPTDNTSAGVS